MDVEGYEVEVIEGMTKLLKTGNPPKLFFIEVHSQLLNKRNMSCKYFIDLMQKFSYGVYSARYRGNKNIVVHSSRDLLDHDLCEIGYWEVFFERDKPHN